MVSTAVILAAGLGSRLKHHTEAQPKGFLMIDNLSLIERSLINLTEAGITKIIIGTGYLHTHFDILKKKYPVVTRRNIDYASTGSMYTLYMLQELVKEPFLLLESDLLYDPVALRFLLEDSREDLILASGQTHSGDEVYIQANEANLLQQMSKVKSLLTHITGELVGITRLSVEALREMSQFAVKAFSEGKKLLNYEDALVGIASTKPIHIKLVEDLVWCEIDDEHHLDRALKSIYPKLQGR
jgi:2-aminoethylphosphonate-pyruvate transaminase